MAKKESENISEDIRELEKDIHFYKTELMMTRPSEYVYEVRKLLNKAEEKKRHLTFKLHETERKEGIAEKNSIKK
jgi:uncharacterized membrane protein YgaE (UPF0421/DUF939 family)